MFIPFWEGGDTRAGFHGRVLRYDVTRPFAEPGSWQVAEAGATDGLCTVGFNAGAFDGRFIYFAPWRVGTGPNDTILPSGCVLRYDTLGDAGAFSLRAGDIGHNGGLCAAAPGPVFLEHLIEPDHPAQAIEPLVGHLDLSAFEALLFQLDRERKGVYSVYATLH